MSVRVDSLNVFIRKDMIMVMIMVMIIIAVKSSFFLFPFSYCFEMTLLVIFGENRIDLS
jgi:hypothetical protein